MKKVLKFLVFMAIWITGCAFVDLVVPDIANAWQMAIGLFTGTLGWIASERF
jgi:hypothetical protein